jgi:peptidoglycan hydrolase-like protein with peptidoglycan-binding domain
MVRRGDTSESVRLVQSLLQAKGCDLEVDGFFGPNTEAAVKDFQGAANLSVDGVVGPNTWSALDQ